MQARSPRHSSQRSETPMSGNGADAPVTTSGWPATHQTSRRLATSGSTRPSSHEAGLAAILPLARRTLVWGVGLVAVSVGPRLSPRRCLGAHRFRPDGALSTNRPIVASMGCVRTPSSTVVGDMRLCVLPPFERASHRRSRGQLLAVLGSAYE